MKLFSISLFILLFNVSCGENSSVDNQKLLTSDTTTSVNIDSIQADRIVHYPGDDYHVSQDYTNDGVRCGFKDSNHVLVIKHKFEMADGFYEGVAAVVYKGKHGFCDTSGNLITTFKDYKFCTLSNEMSGLTYFRGATEGLYMVENNEGKIGFVNGKNELIVPFNYDNAEAFSQGKAVVGNDAGTGFVDTKGNLVIETKYENANSFQDSLAAVFIDDKIGFINHSGELVIPATYEQVYFFNEGLCVVTNSDDYTNYFYIDKTGKKVIEGPFENAGNFLNGEAEVMKKGKCKIIDTTGKVLRSSENCFMGC